MGGIALLCAGRRRHLRLIAVPGGGNFPALLCSAAGTCPHFPARFFTGRLLNGAPRAKIVPQSRRRFICVPVAANGAGMGGIAPLCAGRRRHR